MEGQGIQIRGGGKAHVVHHIVNLIVFQGPRCKIILPCGGIAHLAAGDVVGQPRFQVGTDFPVNGQGHIVPAHVAAFAVRAVVQLHIEECVGLQALLGGDGVVLFLFPQQGGNSGLFRSLNDLRVIPHQHSIDALALHLDRFGFRGTVIADSQGSAVVKADGDVACPPPFAPAGRGFDLARGTAERPGDHIYPVLQGQIFIALGNLNGLFLQLREDGGGRLRLLRRFRGRAFRRVVSLRRFRLGGWLVAVGGVFLHSHTGCGGFLCDLGLHLLFVLLQINIEVGQAGRLRELILALIEKRAALAHIVQNGVEIGDLLRGQRFPGL